MQFEPEPLQEREQMAFEDAALPMAQLQSDNSSVQAAVVELNIQVAAVLAEDIQVAAVLDEEPLEVSQWQKTAMGKDKELP